MISMEQIEYLINFNPAFRTLATSEYPDTDLKVSAYGNNSVLIKKPPTLRTPWYFSDRMMWGEEMVRIYFQTLIKNPLVIFRSRTK